MSGDSLSVKIRARIAESVERRKSKSFHGHTSVTHNQEALNVCVKMFGFYFIFFFLCFGKMFFFFFIMGFFFLFLFCKTLSGKCLSIAFLFFWCLSYSLSQSWILFGL